MPMTQFAKRLEQLLRERDMYAPDLAKEVNIAANTIYRYLRGERMPPIESAIEMADYFDVSLPWILGISEARTTEYSPEAMEVARLYSLADTHTKKVIDTILEAVETSQSESES